MNWILWLCLLGYHSMTLSQKVAPGVPPQHYQPVPQQQAYHPPPPGNPQQIHQPQHQQQQQQQHQQQQYQQMPQHQGQVPHPQQHVPVQHQGQHAGHFEPPQQLFNAAHINQEKDHIAEHADVPIDTSKMTDAELQFHYFKMHDADNNNKLDGCELIKSLIHWHEQGSKHDHGDDKPKAEERIFLDNELEALIDPILKSDDINQDGFIDYSEFIRAQEKTQNSTERP